MKLLFSFIKNKSDKMGRIELTNLNRVLVIGANRIFFLIEYILLRFGWPEQLFAIELVFSLWLQASSR